jgi:hypothetical protein
MHGKAKIPVKGYEVQRRDERVTARVEMRHLIIGQRKGKIQ